MGTEEEELISFLLHLATEKLRLKFITYLRQAHSIFHRPVLSMQTSNYPLLPFFSSWIPFSFLKFKNLIIVYCVYYHKQF